MSKKKRFHNIIRLFILLVVLFISNQQLLAQKNNLVLNPSFEDYNYCTKFPDGIYYGYADYWNMPHYGVCDYFHGCSNDSIESWVGIPHNFLFNSFANTGIAYATMGIYENLNDNKSWREYIQGTLKDTLVSTRKYIASFYISRGGRRRAPLCIDNIGIYFSDTILDFGNFYEEKNLPLNPQFKNTIGNILLPTDNEWQKVEGTFIAGGGEKYFTIGNFDDNAHTRIYDCFGIGADTNTLGYLYPVLDDVSIIDPTLIDTVNLCVHDSLFLEGAWRSTAGLFYDTLAGIPYQRYLQPSTYNSTHTFISYSGVAGDSIKTLFFWTKITAGMDSTIVLNLPSFTGCDSTVSCRIVDNTGIKNLKPTNDSKDMSLLIYPNPSSDYAYIEFKATNPELKNKSNIKLLLYNFMGQEIKVPIESKQINAENIQYKLDLSKLSKGMYFVKVLNKNNEFLASGRLVCR